MAVSKTRNPSGIRPGDVVQVGAQEMFVVHRIVADEGYFVGYYKHDGKYASVMLRTTMGHPVRRMTEDELKELCLSVYKNEHYESHFGLYEDDQDEDEDF